MSDQLVWEIIKRPHNGGSRFSRDPINVASRHSYKYSGSSASVYIASAVRTNDQKSIGVQPAAGGKGVTVITKNAADRTAHSPAKSVTAWTYSPYKSQRKIAKSIVNTTLKKGYRPDLTSLALARASAIARSQRHKAGEHVKERKPRGRKALKTE